MVRRGQSRRNSQGGRGKGGNQGSQGKRPSQTIDLSASEVKTEEERLMKEGASKSAVTSSDISSSEKLSTELPSKESVADGDSNKPGAETVKKPETKKDSTNNNTDKNSDKSAEIKDADAGKVKTSAHGSDKGSQKDLKKSDGPSGRGGDGAPPETGSKRAGGGSFFKLLAASIIGAVLALAGQQFMPRLITNSETAALSNLESEVQSLREAVGGLSSSASEATQDKISELEKALATVEQAAEGDGDVKARMAKVEKTMQDLTKLAEGDDAVAGVAAIATRVNDIEGRVNEAIEGLRSDFSTKFRRELEQVSKEIAAQESLTQIEGVKLTASTLGKKLAQLDAQSGQIQNKIEQLTASVEALKGASISKPEVESLLGDVKTQLSEVTTKLAAVTAREKQAHEAARKSALALAISNLKRAMNRGDGFGEELDGVKRLAAKELDFSALEPLSNSGVPTEQGLLEAYPALAVSALAVETKTEDGSTWDLLVSKARTAVNYRRTGDVEGDGNEAVLARMEHKFKEGHVEDVLVEAKALTGQAAQVMAPWIKKLEARLMVERAMQDLEDQLLTTLEPRAPNR